MTRSINVPRWLILLLVAFAARAITFGNPILHVDEEFYFTAARMMTQGAIPYVDIWDRKPIGLFLLYAPAASLGYPAGIWVYQALALICLFATALLTVRLATRAGWETGATAAGIAVILWPNLLDGQGGQAPVFYNLLMIAAATLVAPRSVETSAARRLAQGCAAMALVGITLQIKYSAVFEGAFFGLWLLWREWRDGARLPRLALLAVPLAGIALAPTLLAWAIYAGMGEGETWLYANFRSILDRQSDPLPSQLGNLAILVLILSPLAAMAMRARRRRSDAATQRAMANFLFAWAAASLFGVAIFGAWFNHYGLPLIPPLAACAAGVLGTHRRFAAIVLTLVFIGGQVTLLVKRLERGTPAQVAAIARAIGPGAGCLHVYSGTTMLYAMTGRCAVTRWIFPSHLSRDREAGAVGADAAAELQRILHRRPQWVVVRGPYRGEIPAIRAQMVAALSRDYVMAGDMPLGRDRYALWRARASSRATISRE
ncbi:hypothetical protein [Sphingomonas turrisvirgatae]|uniref:Glycosyltransferase RgtA/B/C/D-like domain-containing protein n=1 Tax=Sphingomonas turrisvirgatae TaxID=1888892 RepID=A0A1E3LTF1_9SPHN|nr:hypothetical protein [Sphingomonas turrisvirgatae]ODP36100.1 hypothetical protein BFL28_08190 [Sphingomonas turrisvirgatae]